MKIAKLDEAIAIFKGDIKAATRGPHEEGCQDSGNSGRKTLIEDTKKSLSADEEFLMMLREKCSLPWTRQPMKKWGIVELQKWWIVEMKAVEEVRWGIVDLDQVLANSIML